jgi:hypothetical protein
VSEIAIERSTGSPAAAHTHASDASSYQLGRLSFTLTGHGGTAAYLRSELESVANGEHHEGAERVAFDFADRLPSAPGGTRAGPLVVREHGYRVSYNRITYDVEGTPDNLHVVVAPPEAGWRRRLAPEWLLRAADWNFLSTAEQHAKNFMYGVFDHITQVAQLPVGQSYVHASSFERDGEGVALLAWGGIGKTSAALKLITEHGWRFLSDDLGLVDDDGILWRTPKRLQVYAYNLAGQARLREMLMAGRSAMDRAAWSWWLHRHGPSGVRRRVSAEALFGAEHIAHSAPLTRLFYLWRTDVPRFATEPLSAHDAAQRGTEVVMQEIEPFGYFSRAMHGGAAGDVLPSVDEVRAATRDVLLRAFRDVPASTVLIPSGATPDDLAAYLLSQLGARSPGGRG